MKDNNNNINQKTKAMNDFDEILKKLKEGIGSMAEEAQGKYNELVNYLDTHDSEDIKKELSKVADKVAQGAREGVEKAKEEIGKIDIDEKMAQAREGVEKAKEEIGKIDIDEKVAKAREGVEKAKEYMDSGLDAVHKQWDDLCKRFNL